MAWTIPANVVSGTQIQAATTNAILADLAVIGGATGSWVPTLTGITLGTGGTVTGDFKQVDKMVDFSLQVTLGTGAAVSGCTFTLPATAASRVVNRSFGDANVFDGTNRYPLIGVVSTTSVVTVRAFPSTAGAAVVAIGASVPLTWASGNVLTVAGRYEAA